ncbi:hypothetical protein FOXG_10229 [Fusarium oxysporum f. sp. lycopersici 4287]|uniref:Tyrosinase copper-binding domain-containing protein n=3 Tax=Fusarium oxysporum TaxID=5507 RepID=A0A0J9VFE8_FUSO4|nr:hypothetical protein FOXG_10229 [Fusarium oxysporum f. sp. lycopersici 4287]EXK27727.1 hypothetical protein FOMG_15953 [Fusarium oxysporum f. sp. melonis 26406]KNB09708.1 hypothetical protein FOXG_10229 [Fusarium oxysporum f. sp. lycopersici 4287]
MVDLRGLKHMPNTTPFSGFSEKVRSMAATSLFLLTQDLVGMGPIQMDVEKNSTLGNETYVQQCHNKSSYRDFWEATGFTTHGAGHSGIGGAMEGIDASPGDPLFYLHHCFVDRLW